MANVNIDDLTAAGALDGSEAVEVLQGGLNKQTTTQAIADLGGGGAATWGAIGGMLPNQADLQAALDDIKNKQGFSSLYAL